MDAKDVFAANFVNSDGFIDKNERKYFCPLPLYR